VRRLLTLMLAASAAALAALLARRLILEAETQAGLAHSGGSRTTPAPGPAPGGPVSTSAARAAAQSLPGTREELYRQAASMGVRGRSKMNKQQLQEAVLAKRAGGEG
jgi:Rho termination factor, N-terminal domain